MRGHSFASHMHWIRRRTHANDKAIPEIVPNDTKLIAKAHKSQTYSQEVL